MSRAYRRWKARVKECRREGLRGGVFLEFRRGFPMSTPIISAPTTLSFYMQRKRMVRREAKRYLKYKRDIISKPGNREMLRMLATTNELTRMLVTYLPAKEE